MFKDKKLLIVCNTFRGRRLKFYELQKQLFDENKILILSGHNVPGYNNLLVYNNLEQLKQLVLEYDPDVVHCNIDKTAPARVILDLGYKTVLDVHDYSKLRGIDDPGANEVYKTVDYVIFVNNILASLIQLNAKIKNSTVITSMVPGNWMIKKRKKLIKYSVVSIGSLAKGVAYRNLDILINKIKQSVSSVHIYAPVGGSRVEGITVHQPIFQGKEFYREISQYHIGLLAINKDISELDLNYAREYGLSNRVFDYMAARIPTLGINMGKMVNSYIENWGIAIDDTEDIEEAMVQLIIKNKRIDYDYWQDQYNLDNYFEILKGIYETVLDER